MESVKQSLTSKIMHRLSNGAYGRSALRRAARRNPCRIVIGARGSGQPGWTATECGVLNPADPGHWASYFRLDSIDALLAEHVWEHLSLEEGIEAARICYDFLKPGGYLRVAVPDGNHPNRDYIEWVKPDGAGPDSKDHKMLFDYRTFIRLFETAGFIVKPLEYFDEFGNFYYCNWRPQDGFIQRSRRFDQRNSRGQLIYTSIILDVIKPLPVQQSVINAA
jgi:predicted SAM-dependent methyltransferase